MNNSKKNIVFVFLFVLALAACAPDPRDAAQADAIRMKAEQDARQLAQVNRQLARKASANLRASRDNLHARQRQLARKAITDGDLLDWWTDHPEATNAETAKRFGISRQAVQQRRINLTLPQK
jgi:DNA-binding CsgD family transcriptional regulator